ncbi:MAG: bifunctional 5,10-methylenetetrahydrofolate dehydrogenase/5,10-methenyltetrahydrofolate cyclohydrolase [Candidatus Thermoplasmatota archaeon]|nr:bifunctional 5,10-methylenetetrahydrofolate dehydrogenase/5,10-methenyltetrahydrofolate cyclohydrolase [Candidatus Thermoplasmatota archaeon]
MEILRGKPVVDRIDKELKLISCNIGTPMLVVYLIGADEASVIYSRSKIRKGEKIGVKVVTREFPLGTPTEQIVGHLCEDAADPDVHGIMIERPLSIGVDIQDLIVHIPPSKDVEGLHPENYGLLGMGVPRFIPPTPLGALLLMQHYRVRTEGKEIVVVGRSPNVGRPLAALLSQKAPWGNATVTTVHTRTQDISVHTRRADIIITAVGIPRLIRGEMIKKGAVLIDLGINPVEDGIVGDVDLGSVSEVAGAATPTPGGTGPVTVSSMFLNLYRATILAGSSDIEFTDEIIGTVYGYSGG